MDADVSSFRISYYGIDAGIQLIDSERLKFFASTSRGSNDVFDNQELSEPDKNVSLMFKASPLQ